MFKNHSGELRCTFWSGSLRIARFIYSCLMLYMCMKYAFIFWHIYCHKVGMCSLFCTECLPQTVISRLSSSYILCMLPVYSSYELEVIKNGRHADVMQIECGLLKFIPYMQFVSYFLIIPSQFLPQSEMFCCWASQILQTYLDYTQYLDIFGLSWYMVWVVPAPKWHNFNLCLVCYQATKNLNSS